MNSNAKEIEELSDGWVRCRSKSNPGRQYFFNRKTGKSSWTEPQPGEKQEKKTKKKKSPIQNQQKTKPEVGRNKSVKRKSNEGDAGSSKKKHKNETPEKPDKKVSPRQYETRSKLQNQTTSKSPVKRLSSNDSKQTTTPPQKRKSSSKLTPTKNSASKRLSQLRSQLNVEAKNEINNEKDKAAPKQDIIETSVRPRYELPSPNVSELVVSTTTKSPNNDSLHSIPSPSQFFAANKIISSMKAQLPEEYCNKEKSKDTFADIEEGICSQVTEYYVIKHPSTPPQFSEASKLVSAIKSKLSYTPKDVKTFPSAQERMEALRASISGEIDERDLQEASNNDGYMLQPVVIATSPIVPTQERCEAMEVEDVREPVETPQPSSLPKDKDSGNGQVVLVVDTNIFIHELDFIKSVLNSHIKGYSEQPMLLVPWRVINELDRLKDNNNGNGALCKRARAAMDYLYKSLPENNRIKGQSLRDANSHIYPCEMPDDEILNCALQQAERGRNVLLLSNDRNLCNKATVNGVRRLGIAELKAMVEHHPTPPLDLVARFDHYQRTVYQLLANILENEMRAKYNNLWLHVIFKPPPWGLADVLQCLLKHWIAVFNEVFPRIEHLIVNLKNGFERIEGKDPITLTESEVSSFKELCLDVAQKCQIIPEYMELAKLTVGRLGRRPSMTDEDERARQTVVGAFEALWNIMSSYWLVVFNVDREGYTGAKLATALGVPHGVEDAIPASETLMNLTGKFAEFNGSIGNFIVTIEGVLKVEDMSSMDEKINRLEAAFRECLQLTRHVGRPDKDDLRSFCLTNRNMLQEAVNKFSQLRQLLDACKTKLEVPA